MISRIIQWDEYDNQPILMQAKKLIENGGLICFPTETVYALAARADSEEAVERIYQLKQRDANKPISLLVKNIGQSRDLTIMDARADYLAAHFFPGPLTMVMKLKSPTAIAKTIRGKNDTIGLRMPDHKMALALLDMLDMPLAATSINYSGQPSALSVDDIPADFLPQLDMVIDGGKCSLGVASTVIDISSNDMIILREGSLSIKEIELYMSSIVYLK